MATSSIHIGTSSAGALIHNERIFSPDYLISNDKNVNDKKHYDNVHISELEKLAKIDYQTHSINNRKLPKTATLIKEAIINLEAHHNLNDLEKVKDTLENEYGYKITDISIHRDEGYIFTDTKNYTMGRNQYKNLDETPHIAELDLKNNKFYEWNLNNNKWVKGEEIKDYKIEKNYHAHIVMLNYDFSKHRTIRNNLKDLSKMQTLVARDLNMERGKCSSTVEAQRIGVEVEQSRKRLNIKEYKVQKRKENELKKEVQELKQEIYNFKDMQKSITAMELTTDEKKELHSLNSKVKNQAATIEELNKKINELTVKNKDNIERLLKREKEIIDLKSLTKNLADESVENFKKAEEYKEKVNTLENQNKALQEQINTKPVQSIENELKALVSSEINFNDIKKNSLELFTSDFKEEINLKENGVFNKTYKIELKQEFKSQEITLENIGLFKRTQMKITNLLETIKNQALRIAGLKKENQILNAELNSERLKNQVLEIKVLNLENKKTLSLTGEDKKENHSTKENLFEKVKRINENEKLFKEQMKEKAQEQEKPKEKYRGYELG